MTTKPKSKPMKTDVLENFSSLLSKLSPMREVDRLYHVTTKENKENILKDGVIKGNMATGFSKGKFNKCPINGILKGVYFSVRLGENGQLPKKSPYGTERIKIPIDQLLTDSHRLFFAWHYNIHTKYYAILVLVNESSEEDFNFCNENLAPLIMHHSPILRWSTDCLEYVKSINLEVEIFIVGDIPLPTCMAWDTVKKTERAKPPQSSLLKGEAQVPKQPLQSIQPNILKWLNTSAMKQNGGSSGSSSSQTKAKRKLGSENTGYFPPSPSKKKKENSPAKKAPYSASSISSNEDIDGGALT